MQGVAAVAERAGDPESFEQGSVADDDVNRPSTFPSTPLPVCERNDSAVFDLNSPLAGGRGDSGRQRVLARKLNGSRQAQQLGVILAGHRHHGNHPWLPLGQRAGLVDHERIDPLQNLECLGVLDQHARGRAPAGADHDRHRRRQPQARTGRR